MDKLREFGRKAMFYVRVLSGYEERRIRNYRLQLEKRMLQAQEKKAALRKIPERVIIDEVRNMVEQMQSLNRKLEEAETAIEEYFKPLDKEAETIIKMQLEGEDRSTKEMMAAMQKQALLEKAQAEKTARMREANKGQINQDATSSSTQHDQEREMSKLIP